MVFTGHDWLRVMTRIVWNQIEPNIGVLCSSYVLRSMLIEALLQIHYFFLVIICQYIRRI